MALPGTPTPFLARGLYDSLDGGAAADGACYYLQNLVHDITTKRVWQPRAAAVVATTFPGFSAPGVVSVSLAVGTRIYGMIATGRNAGHDEPFVYDTISNTFVTVGNVTSGNTPTSLPTTGAWIPPTMDVIGTRVLVTHEGFSGGNFFGWFDISSFSLTFTGDTHNNTTLDNLSINPLNVGIMPGQAISGAGIPANTFIVSYTATAITLSQAATATASGVTFTAAGGTSAAPVWSAGNTNTNPLPSKPTVVFEFFNRAYFACVNQGWFTDPLNSGNITNATNFLTFGDKGLPIIGFGGIPITQTTGGILAAMIVFKSSAGYYQVTGDIALNNLAVNGPIGNIGCIAQRSIVQTPMGLWFLSDDGVHQVDFSGLSGTAPIPNVRYPFHSAVTPSRAAASFNNTVYRISLATIPNTSETVSRSVDYWYDFEITEWGGPHTCANDLCIALGSGFYFASNAHPGTLYLSHVDVVAGNSYIEFGNQLMIVMQSCVLPPSQMTASSIVEATIDLALQGGNDRPTISFLDQASSILASASVPTLPPLYLWNGHNWGAGLWNAAQSVLVAYNVDWPLPITYKRGAFSVTCSSFFALRIGAFWFRRQDLGYTNTQQPA